jgi:hypothetical protein
MLCRSGKEKAPEKLVWALVSLFAVCCATTFEGVVPGAGLEPARCLAPADFESAASTNFATPAAIWKTEIMAQWEPQFSKNRTT